MKKYSKEWKLSKKAWIQKCNRGWMIHYISNDTEYASHLCFSYTEAKEVLKEYKA